MSGTISNARKIGGATIHRVEESLARESPAFFPDLDPARLAEHFGWMAPNCFDPEKGEFIASIHSWLLRTRHHTILIDACAGNHKERPLSPRFHQLDTPYLERLRAVGCAPEDVDFVMCTHLHIDHVGWNTCLKNGRWVPTFPNARYVFSKGERDHWRPENSAIPAAIQQIYRDSVLPVIEAGQDLVIDGHYHFDDEIELTPTPGHTPGHIAVRLRSQGEEGLFTGDIMHQPIQVYMPDLNSRFCNDAALARQTRRQVLEHCAETGCLMLPAHFGAPHAGRVRRKGDGFRFEFEAP